MKIAIAADHAGFEMKKEIINWLKTFDHQILDFGCFSSDSVDYPDLAFPAAESVAANIAMYGILICGTGTGMAITANKITGIRAANCTNVFMAHSSRSHNNANVLALGSRVVSLELAKEIITSFMETDFDGGRHMIRIEKIHNITGL